MSHVPYGYRIENGKAVIDEEKAKQVCQTAHCGRCEQHFIVGAFTSPTVRFGR